MQHLVLALLALVSFFASPALAQRLGGSPPGQFDFYVLALSWSPSFCEAQGERASRVQCAPDRPFSFVVHGLWPQMEKGFPEYCTIPAPVLDRRTVNSILDIMPAPGLVRRQWEKHGTCSGERSAAAYFETVRKARAAVKIPAEYVGLSTYKTVSPEEVRAAFLNANPGMPQDAVAVQCDERRLNEVRICLTRQLAFRSCEEVQRRSCRRDRLVMPPVRQGQRL